MRLPPPIRQVGPERPSQDGRFAVVRLAVPGPVRELGRYYAAAALRQFESQVDGAPVTLDGRVVGHVRSVRSVDLREDGTFGVEVEIDESADPHAVEIEEQVSADGVPLEDDPPETP